VTSIILILISLVPFTGPQTALEAEAMRFAQAWVEGDSQALESMLVSSGILLHILGDLYPSVPPPRALLALRAFLERYSGGEAELMRASQAAGEETRGFAELQWRTLVAGTGEAVIFTLFLAYAMEEGIWTVTEVRVLT